MTTPLAVGLLRDVYTTTAPVDELLDTTRFPTPGAITNHLLNHAITAAYSTRPGQSVPRYTPDTAERTLTLIAQHLHDNNTRDLAWWTIPTWVPRTPRTLISALLGTLVSGLVGLLVFGLMFGLRLGIEPGLIIGSLGGLGFGLKAGLADSGAPNAIRTCSWSQVRWSHVLVAGLPTGLMAGLTFGLLLGPAGGLVAGLAFGLLGGLLGGLTGILIEGLTSANIPKTIRPTDLWRGNAVHGLVAGLAFGLVAALMAGLAYGFVGGLMAGFTAGVTHGLVAGLNAIPLLFMTTAAWKAIISQIYLRINHHTPLRLGRFLEDARTRHLLRTVGPIYQFRHATLQDQLAPPHPLSAPFTNTSRS